MGGASTNTALEGRFPPRELVLTVADQVAVFLGCVCVSGFLGQFLSLQRRCR